jgi:hypothetical protein
VFFIRAPFAEFITAIEVFNFFIALLTFSVDGLGLVVELVLVMKLITLTG